MCANEDFDLDLHGMTLRRDRHFYPTCCSASLWVNRSPSGDHDDVEMSGRDRGGSTLKESSGTQNRLISTTRKLRWRQNRAEQWRQISASGRSCVHPSGSVKCGVPSQLSASVWASRRRRVREAPGPRAESRPSVGLSSSVVEPAVLSSIDC